ncbi:hypothetical protein AB8O64_14005 [Streptomyces sp. QH1-20]|uniref:hypothetical protein n=1 Tax=Streptomyces sp. QH1-20 TaxID=3240934 RepID=UPI003512B4F5
MMSGEFRMPEAVDVLSAIGVLPETQEDSETRVIRIVDSSGGEISFSYDSMERSVRVVWQRGREVIVDLFREGATSVDIRSEAGITYFLVEFQDEGWYGTLKIQVFPILSLKDTLLRN